MDEWKFAMTTETRVSIPVTYLGPRTHLISNLESAKTLTLNPKTHN